MQGHPNERAKQIILGETNFNIFSETMSEISNVEIEATEQELQEVRRNHKQYIQYIHESLNQKSIW